MGILLQAPTGADRKAVLTRGQFCRYRAAICAACASSPRQRLQGEFEPHGVNDFEQCVRAGARSPERLLYKLSRDRPVSRASWVMPRARAMSPSAPASSAGRCLAAPGANIRQFLLHCAGGWPYQMAGFGGVNNSSAHRKMVLAIKFDRFGYAARLCCALPRGWRHRVISFRKGQHQRGRRL